MARHGENIRKRKDGRWEARLLVGHDAEGKARYRWFYGKTYKLAKEKRAQFAAALPKPQSDSPALQTLLADWLAYIRPEVKDSTYARYEAHIRGHILPALGSLPLDSLTTETIEQFARNQLQSGRRSGNGGLSPKTVNGMLSVLKLALEYGRQHRYPVSAAVQNVRKTEPEIRIFTPGEQQRLEKYLIDHRNPRTLGVLLGLYAGLRIGEVCGLKWEDVDFSGGTLQIERTVLRLPQSRGKTRLVISSPKTPSSHRRIPLPGFLLELLAQMDRTEGCFLLSGRETPLEPRAFYTDYKRILAHVSLERYNFHALRHTFATRCVEQNFDVKSLSEILGHADVTMTLRRYVHPTMELKRQQMERLAAGFCGQTAGQTGRTAGNSEKIHA